MAPRTPGFGRAAWPWNSIRVRFGLTTFAIAATASACLYFAVSSWYVSQTRTEVARVANTLADVSASAIAEPFRDGRSDVVKDLLQAILIDLDVAYVVLTDAYGMPAVSMERRRGVRDLSAETRARTGFSADGEIYRTRRSVIGRNGRDLVGTLGIGYSLDTTRADIRTAKQITALLSLTVLFFSFACAYFVTKGSIDAIERLSHATERIAAGDATPGLTIKRSDELGRASSALARIAEALGARRFSVVIENGTPDQEVLPEALEETRIVTSTVTDEDTSELPPDTDDYRADLVCDPSGTILYVSHEGRQTLGYSTHELVGAAVSSVVHPEDRRMLREMINSGATADGAVVRCARGDGSWRAISFEHALSADPVAGGDTHLVLVDAENDERLRRRSEGRFTRSHSAEMDTD